MTLPRRELPEVFTEGSFGIPASETQKAMEVDVYKELVNKIAWAVGSCYGRPYANKRNIARQIAVDLANKVILEKGWPVRIRK